MCPGLQSDVIALSRKKKNTKKRSCFQAENMNTYTILTPEKYKNFNNIKTSHNKLLTIYIHSKKINSTSENEASPISKIITSSENEEM